MDKRSIGWVLTGIFGVALTGLIAPGCGHSLRGDCMAICQESCETGDACEDYAGFQKVDREDCLADCDNTCDDLEDNANDQCDDGVEIDGAQVDSCLTSIRTLGNVCRADDESELAEAVGDYLDECVDGNSPLFRCR